jgi:hypothetical protein
MCCHQYVSRLLSKYKSVLRPALLLQQICQVAGCDGHMWM